MKTAIGWAAAFVLGAAPAWASDCASCAAPSAREIQSAVDSYLAPASADTTLVGGPGSAGYDGGFWIRGGSFLMKINLTIQTRWEGFDWDDSEFEPRPGGDLSGFSLPRVTLKLSGDATCDVHYYAELEFGHVGERGFELPEDEIGQAGLLPPGSTAGLAEILDFALREELGSDFQPDLDDPAREAWIEYEAAPAFAFRMGLLKTAATRQLMTAPELQQFVDISMASAFIGSLMPGYTDRNRDYGLMVHGVLGCDGDLSYMATVTNGDGPVHRNVIDGGTSDNLAYSARVNWDFLGHIGYEEGAVRQSSCEWYGSVGAWGHYYADHASERPYVKFGNRLTWGVDLALGYGGWSFTAAYNSLTWDESDDDIEIDAEGSSWFAQVGYLFPDTAWELAVRYSQYSFENDSDFDDLELGATEWAAAVNFYIDGHADKLTLDAAFIQAEDDGNLLFDAYAGYNSTFESDAVLIRFQWQLAL